MIKKGFFFVVVLFSIRIVSVNADGLTGFDLLALQHPLFPLEKVLAEIPNESSLGVLLDTFGEDRAKIFTALKSNKFTSFRIHLANGPGLRNKQLGSYENLYGLDIQSFEKKVIQGDQTLENSFVEKARYVNELVQQFPTIKCYLSPVLEHNLSPKAFLKLSSLIQKEISACQIVNNPVNGWSHQINGTDILEVHGMENPPQAQYLASQDGDFGTKENFLSQHKAALIRFIWKGSYNCRTKGKFVDPRSRVDCG